MKELKSMLCLDIYLEGLGEKSDTNLAAGLKSRSKFIHPLMCWDLVCLGRKQNASSEAIKKLRELAFTHDWEIDFAKIRRKYFDALVVTDTNQRIGWVSEGFETMTGYSASEVLNLKPSVLQGQNTCLRTKRLIREAIRQKKGIKATLLNYKKDGSPYQCRIEILPLFNSSKIITHYLALEKSV